MNKFEKYWLTHQSLSQITSLTTTIFVAFYLWQTTQSFPVILNYNLGLFAALPLAVLISCLFSKLFGLKISQIFSHLFQLCFILLLLTFQPELFAHPLVFGLISALSLGSSLAPISIINSKINPGSRLNLNSKIKIGAIIAATSAPPILSRVVESTNSFNIPFILSAAICLFLLILSLFIEFPALDGKFNLLEILKFPGTNPEKSIFAKASFLIGFKDGIHFFLISILALNLIGSIASWGIFKFAFSLLALLIVLAYKKLPFAKQSIIPLGIGAIIFFLGSAYFVYDFSLIGIYVYTLALTIFDVFFGFGFVGAISRLTSLDISEHDLDSEYTFLQSIFTSAGMILPILFLSYFKVDLLHSNSFLATIIVISLIPFIILKVMSNSFYLTHQNNEADQTL